MFRFVSPVLKRPDCLWSWVKSDAVEVKQIVIINNFLFRNVRGSALCYRQSSILLLLCREPGIPFR